MLTAGAVGVLALLAAMFGGLNLILFVVAAFVIMKAVAISVAIGIAMLGLMLLIVGWQLMKAWRIRKEKVAGFVG